MTAAPALGPCVFELVLPIHTISEANGREHWTKKSARVKSHRTCAALLCANRIGKRSPPCAVTLTRIAPRALDGDNLQSALKATRDGVADWLGVDDRDPRVTWLYGQRKGKPKEYAVEVVAVFEVEDSQ